MLSNTLILDLANEEGEFCSKVLADLGARVIRIDSPDAGQARRSYFHSYNNLNKCRIVLNTETSWGRRDLSKLLDQADILIETTSAGRQKAIESEPSRLIRISFSEQTSYPESLYGAIAAVLSLRKREITGSGCHIDLSSRSAGDATPDYWADDQRDSQILPCKDGFIQLAILRNWETLVELMKAEQIQIEETCRENSIEQIASHVAKWTRRHSKGELFELGQSMRFPWAPVEKPEEVLQSPQLRARRFFVPSMLPEGGPVITFPGAPYKFSAYAPPPPELTREKEIRCNTFPTNQKILSGLRVVDLTRMIAGPYVTRILADFGAEVIKIQSRDTATGAERNDTPQFALWNRNKRSLCLDLDHPEAKDLFIRLVAISDVVVENFSPRVMPNWGLDYSRLQQVKPDLVMASISAMGQTGPWKDFVGFASTFHALSGLLSVATRYSDFPTNLRVPYADIVTALYSTLAILAALENRDRTGGGRYLDVSAYEATCTMIGPDLIACAAGMEAKNNRQDFNRSPLLHWEENPEGSKAAPALGQDNHYVIVELLGHSEAEYESLVAKGIL